MRSLRLLLTVLAALLPVSAQPTRAVDHNLNGWLMYFGDHAVSERWGVHLEGQWRRHDVAAKPQQLLLRPGVNYKVSDAVMLTAGYAFVDTHRYGEFPAPGRFPEHRTFQQAALRHSVGKVGLMHRYRLEQRSIGTRTPDPTTPPSRKDTRYENRFRYMLRGVAPIPRSEWYGAAYNELFVNFGRNVAFNVFDQNRAYLALGRKMGPAGNLEFGYLNQVLQQRSGRVLEVNHTLQIGWFSQFSFRR